MKIYPASKELNELTLLFSVSPSNQLWGINREGLLLRRHTKYIVKDTAMEQESSQRSAARGTSTGSDEGDWELV